MGEVEMDALNGEPEDRGDDAGRRPDATGPTREHGQIQIDCCQMCSRDPKVDSDAVDICKRNAGFGPRAQHHA